MARDIKKVGVLGAGTMGSGIAALLAKAGVEVVLLDKFEGFADKAVDRMVKAKVTDAFNAGFMTADHAKFIKTGTTDNNLQDLADCDWIIETILVPDPKIRQDLYKEVQKIAKPDAIFSSNTSMDTTGEMTVDQDDDFKSRFANTHFFNPPPTMALLEIIRGEKTDPDVVKALEDFGDKVLGKKVVECKDERGFIANRIGMFFLERVLKEMENSDFGIEDADAILSQAFGFPLGPFRLGDEVGLDVVDHVRSDFHESLPEGDHFQEIFTGNDDLRQMLKDGYVGNRKADSKGGYYRKKTEDGKPVKDERGKTIIQARNLETGDYADSQKSDFYKFDKQIKKYRGFDKFFDSGDPASEFAWPILRDSLIYVLDHAEELAFDVQAVDDAMRAGYNWNYGPFELLDKFGVEWFTNKLEEEGIAAPALLEKANGQPFYQELDALDGVGKDLMVRHFDGSFLPIRREEGVLSLEDIKRKSEPLLTHNSASLWDIGDGVACLEFTSKENTIDPSVLYVMNESIKLISESDGEYKGMVIYNDGVRFSVGANLALVEVFMHAAEGNWGEIIPGKLDQKWENRIKKYANMFGIDKAADNALKPLVHELVYQGQSVYTALQQAPFPVVGAPKGQAPKSAQTVNLAVGGGCEVLLNCDAVVSGPDQVMALPEIAIGVLPAWTGSTRYLQRSFNREGQFKGPMAPVKEAAATLGNPALGAATSAQDAKKKMWLRPDDTIVMNPDRVLAEAKAKVLEMAPDYKPEPLPTFRLGGSGSANMIRQDVERMYEAAKDNPSPNNVNHVDIRSADRLARVLTGGDTLKPEDVDHHVASNQQQIKDLASQSPSGHLKVNPTIEFNYSRMMQLERDGFMTGFFDKQYTWPRVHYTVAKGGYLREPIPENPPTAKEMRDTVERLEMPRRDVTGQPLSGDDAKKLKAMADMTGEFYKQNGLRGKPGDLQPLRTLNSIRRVMKLI
ncbi:MAG: hypothetical protein H6867_07115 [Rhodospirillales bacterium]|nr:hypothetical protein [Rhodospirillales bacterium]MCB9995320.1 hypothetical protein [Rhodospirillales bacterium]